MKFIVIGGAMAGMSAAWALRENDHEVVITPYCAIRSPSPQNQPRINVLISSGWRPTI